MPMSTTVGSSSIAVAIPRFSASAYRVVVAADPGTVSVGEDMCVGLLGLRSGSGAGTRDGLLDPRARVRFDRIEFVLRRGVLGRQTAPREQEWILLLPGRGFLGGLVRLGVALVVTPPAVGLGLEEDRTATFTAARHGGGRRVPDGGDVVAVEPLRVNAVGPPPPPQRPQP